MDILRELEKRAKAGSYYSINDTAEKVLELREAKKVFDLWYCERFQSDVKRADLAYTEKKRNNVRVLRDLADSIEAGKEIESEQAAKAIQAASSYL